MAYDTIRLTNDHRIEIDDDHDMQSPFREYDCAGTLLTWHRKYSFSDDALEDYVDTNEVSTAGDIMQQLSDKYRAIVLPVYLYDHSGLSVNTTGFRCPWDSGMVGVIFMSRDTIIKEISSYRPTRLSRLKEGYKPRVTASDRQKARELMQAEIETLDLYLTEGYFGYTIYNGDDEHVDSCWGILGSKYCREEALEAAKGYGLALEEE